MDHQDRQAIEGLFSKLGEVERQAGPRDAEADGLIRARITAQPAAPYFMAQTIVIQEQALNTAQARIEELERNLASCPAGRGGLLSGLFGGGQPQRPPEPRTDNKQGYPSGSAGNPAMAGTPWGGAGQTAGAQPGRGGFLAGAAQTAMGVAGGMMIGSMLGSAFGGGGANAADAAKPAPEPAAEDDGGDLGFSNDDI